MANRGRVPVSVAAILMALGGWATSAAAQSPEPTLSLMPTNGAAPANTTISGTDFLGVGPVTFTIDGAALGSTAADAGGSVSLMVTITGSPGPKVVEACQADADGTPCIYRASATFSVNPPATTTTITTPPTTTTSTTTTTTVPPTTTTSTTTTTTSTTTTTTVPPTTTTSMTTTTTVQPTTTSSLTTTTTQPLFVAPLDEGGPGGGAADPGEDPASAAPPPGDGDGGRRIWPYVVGLSATGLLVLAAIALQKRSFAQKLGSFSKGAANPTDSRTDHPDFAWKPTHSPSQHEATHVVQQREAKPAGVDPKQPAPDIPTGPSPSGPVPIPYPNISSAESGSDEAPPPPPPEPDVVDPVPPASEASAQYRETDAEFLSQSADTSGKYPENMRHEIRESPVAEPDGKKGGTEDLNIGLGELQEADPDDVGRVKVRFPLEEADPPAGTVPGTDLTDIGGASESDGTDLIDIGSPSSEAVPTHNPEWTNHNVSDPGRVNAPESEIDRLDSEPAAEQEGNKGVDPETTVEEGEQ